MEIQRSDVVALHLELSNKPVLANRVVAVGSSVFSHAIVRGGEIPDKCNPFLNISVSTHASIARTVLPNDTKISMKDGNNVV